MHARARVGGESERQRARSRKDGERPKGAYTRQRRACGSPILVAAAQATSGITASLTPSAGASTVMELLTLPRLSSTVLAVWSCRHCPSMMNLYW
eukprot:266626-Pleurochrysis_carterae.AAC.1